MVFTVTLSKTSTLAVTVGYQTSNGTATAGTDYVSTFGTATIPHGFTTAQVTVPIFPTNIVVGTNRYFFVNLTTFTNAAPGRTNATGTILENRYRTIQVSATDVVRQTNGITNATFAFNLNPPASTAVTLQYQTADGTAVAGVDYAAKAGTIYFPSGSSNATLSVPVFGSNLAQSNQLFYLLLSQPNNAVLNANEQLVHIINTVTFPPVAISMFQQQGTNALLGFNSIKGRYYRFETTQALPAQGWSAVTDPLLGTGSFIQVAAPTTNTTAYYRLVLLP
jgi:chitinase